MLIFMVICSWFSGLSKTNAFGTVTEEKQDVTFMSSWFLSQPNKLFEGKLFVNFTLFHLFYFLEVFATVHVFHN